MWEAFYFLTSLNPPKYARLELLITQFTDGEIQDQRLHRLEIQTSNCPHPKPLCSFTFASWKCGALVTSSVAPNLTGVAEWNLVDWGWRGVGTTVLLSH